MWLALSDDTNITTMAMPPFVTRLSWISLFSTKPKSDNLAKSWLRVW